MKTISVSTDVYAKIWSLRISNEDSEDAVLRRVLGCSIPPKVSPKERIGIGYFDARHNARFDEGFEIYRTYLSKKYRAVAKGGRWHLHNDGKSYESLNRLSSAIGVNTENAWVNWYYTDCSGRRRKIADLRDPEGIDRRSSPELRITPPNSGARSAMATWCDDIVTALENLGGDRAPLMTIYEEVKQIRHAAGRTVPPSLQATVRECLERHSSDSDKYNGGLDLFCMPDGKGKGVWGLRKRSG